MVTSQLKSIYDLATGRALGSRDVGWWCPSVWEAGEIVLWSAVILRQKAVLELRETSDCDGADRSRAARASFDGDLLVLGLLGCAVGLVLLVLPGL